MGAGTEADGAGTAAEGRYAYCIIRSSQPRSFEATAIGGRGDAVSTVHYRDLAAVVSPTPLVHYDPTRANVLAHEGVIEAVMREFTVLPLAFGTLFRSDEDLVELMRATYDTLHDTVEKMEGKVEFGLKASWDPAREIADVEQANESIRRLKSQLTAGNAPYLAQMELGRLIETALRSRTERLTQEIHALLRDCTVAAQENKTIGERMIMNAAFLVERAREPEFVAAVEQVGERYEGRLSFQLSGPWPPYNFVTIRLKLQPNEPGAAAGA